MINATRRGERGQGFHWQDVTKLGCHCSLLPSLENYSDVESNLQLHQRASCRLKPLCSVLGHIFYLFMIIRYEEIYIEWTIFDIFGDQFFKGTCTENLHTLLNVDPIKFEYNQS